jgi:UPF0755 protein
MKTTGKVISFLFASVLTAFLLMGFYCWSFLHTPLVAKSEKPVDIIFAQGMSARGLADGLKEQKLMKHPLLFTLFVRLKGEGRHLQAGEYSIEPGITTPSRLLTKMANGDVINHAFTIVEGWTFNQVIVALNENPYVKHTIQNLNTDEIMDKIGRSGEFPEGRFAPNTYLFGKNVKDIDVLSSAYQLMQNQLQTAWANKGVGAPYKCPYEALIAASLIEKETGFEPEKTEIAGVIVRRLNIGRALQIDPTVIYGMGEKYKGKLYKKDLLVDSTYNTYTRQGLPPTPIAMPSISSIKAALHPADSASLYYVSKGDGSHEFSETFKQQDKAVEKYVRSK